MSSGWWRRLAGVAGVFMALACLSVGAQARPVTGSLGGVGGGGGCAGDAYFCGLGAQTLYFYKCESLTALDIDCLDAMNIPNSDESARQAQRVFGEPVLGGPPGLPRSVTGSGLRRLASIVGTGPVAAPDDIWLDVSLVNDLVLRLVDPFDVLDGPLLLALSPTAGSVSYLLLDARTSFDGNGVLRLNLGAMDGLYQGLTLYEATGAVPEPGSVALTLLALALGGVVAGRRRRG